MTRSCPALPVSIDYDENGTAVVETYTAADPDDDPDDPDDDEDLTWSLTRGGDADFERL